MFVSMLPKCFVTSVDAPTDRLADRERQTETNDEVTYEMNIQDETAGIGDKGATLNNSVSAVVSQQRKRTRKRE